MLENARLPSFQIKRLIDRSSKRRKEAKERQTSKSATDAPKKPTINQGDLKKYWENYLSNEMGNHHNFCRSPRGGFSPLLSSSKKGKEQFNNTAFEGHKRDESIFQNNFIRSKTRQRKDKGLYLKEELSLKERRDALWKSVEEDAVNKMAPWEKDNEEDFFNLQNGPFSHH